MEDSRIVALYWARDEEAIRATASKYGSYCRSIADNILRSREDAEEIPSSFPAICAAEKILLRLQV